MRRALLLLVLLPGLATAASFQEIQALTRPDPSGNPLDAASFPVTPLSLSTATRYRITVCAPSGATLSGTGTIRLWLWVSALQQWSSNPDSSLTVNGTGACQSWGLPADVRIGYLLPALVGVGVSSGSTATVRAETDSF